MPGLVPGTHVFRATKQDVGGRDKPGHDAVGERDFLARGLQAVRDAPHFTPSPRLRGEGGVRGRLHKLRLAEAPLTAPNSCVPPCRVAPRVVARGQALSPRARGEERRVPLTPAPARPQSRSAPTPAAPADTA